MSTPLSTLHARRMRLAVVALTLVVLGVMASAAKCIQRTSTYVDGDGYTHIAGEIVNDTETQATKMMVQGTLYDANGAVVAQKIAPTCPPDSQPHQQTVFDIKFDNPVAPWTRYEVLPAGGKALPSLLPDPQIAVFNQEAIRYTQPIQLPGIDISTRDVFLKFDIKNQSNNIYFGVQGCVAVFDQPGNVVYVSSEEMLMNLGGIYLPAMLFEQDRVTVYLLAPNVPKGPVQARAWLWFGQKGDPTSDYRFISTGFVTIQSRAP